MNIDIYNYLLHSGTYIKIIKNFKHGILYIYNNMDLFLERIDNCKQVNEDMESHKSNYDRNIFLQK
jgi:hypothetical protein